MATAKRRAETQDAGGLRKEGKRLPKVPTGIAGLDLVLGGGLPGRTPDASQRRCRERQKPDRLAIPAARRQRRGRAFWSVRGTRLLPCVKTPGAWGWDLALVGAEKQALPDGCAFESGSGDLRRLLHQRPAGYP